jgi:hypothetical protein
MIRERLPCLLQHESVEEDQPLLIPTTTIWQQRLLWFSRSNDICHPKLPLIAPPPSLFNNTDIKIPYHLSSQARNKEQLARAQKKAKM